MSDSMTGKVNAIPAEMGLAMEAVLRALARKFCFGGFDIEDVRQQAWVFAMEALPRYDRGGDLEDGSPRRPLANFLYVHVKNRLSNHKRNKWKRADPPCAECAAAMCPHMGNTGQKLAGCHGGAGPCERHKLWVKRNLTKSSLASAMAILDGEESGGGPAVEERDREQREGVVEVEREYGSRVPVWLRTDYLRMMAGQWVPVERKKLVRASIEEVARRRHGEEDEAVEEDAGPERGCGEEGAWSASVGTADFDEFAEFCGVGRDTAEQGREAVAN